MPALWLTEDALPEQRTARLNLGGLFDAAEAGWGDWTPEQIQRLEARYRRQVRLARGWTLGLLAALLLQLWACLWGLTLLRDTALHLSKGL
jgi:hypothetical protein